MQTALIKRSLRIVMSLMVEFSQVLRHLSYSLESSQTLQTDRSLTHQKSLRLCRYPSPSRNKGLFQ